MGGEAVSYDEYTYIGRITEFRHGKNLGDVIRKNNGQQLRYLKNFGEGWGQLSGLSALVFIDNHDNQRGHGAGGFGSILTFFEANMYKIANAFQLAWQYGHVRIMSSYSWPRNIVNGKDEVRLLTERTYFIWIERLTHLYTLRQYCSSHFYL